MIFQKQKNVFGGPYSKNQHQIPCIPQTKNHKQMLSNEAQQTTTMVYATRATDSILLYLMQSH